MAKVKLFPIVIGFAGTTFLWFGLSGCGDRANDQPAVQDREQREIPSHHRNHAGAAPVARTRIEFTNEPEQLQAGEPATWRIQIFSAETGDPVSDFDVVHEKLLHLIVVSKDLSWFNHVHPEYQGGGLFTLPSGVVPRGGKYKLYADYTPQGGSQEVAQHEFEVEGEPRLPDVPQLAADPKSGPWIVKQAKSRPEEEPDVEGRATYEVALMPMPAKLVAGEDMTLHFQIRDSKGAPVKDLQPYLGALGHAVILSSDTQQYLHSHPLGEGGHAGHGEHAEHQHGPASPGGPDVMFHAEFPQAGLYKVWGQFMHQDSIITAAFVLEVAQSAIPGV